jgi:hypothetical protein
MSKDFFNRRPASVIWFAVWMIPLSVLIYLWLLSYRVAPAPSPVEEFPPAPLGGAVNGSIAHGTWYIVISTRNPHRTLATYLNHISIVGISCDSRLPSMYFVTLPMWLRMRGFYYRDGSLRLRWRALQSSHYVRDDDRSCRLAVGVFMHFVRPRRFAALSATHIWGWKTDDDLIESSVGPSFRWRESVDRWHVYDC